MSISVTGITLKTQLPLTLRDVSSTIYTGKLNAFDGSLDDYVKNGCNWTPEYNKIKYLQKRLFIKKGHTFTQDKKYRYEEAMLE